MPKYQPVNILGGCYSDSDRAWSLQDTVNWLPEQAEQAETRTPTQFKTPPGLYPFVEIPGTGGVESPIIPSKPVRGTYNCEGKLFAAIGKILFQITNDGIAIPQGTIPGNTRVTMTHNQISQGNELVAVNGSSGYVYNTLTQVFEKITDEGFPGAIWVGFADGYILGIEPGRRFAFNSEPADALNYNTLDRFTSEYKPDLIVTGIVNNNELILLNETSYEFFENTGATQQPFRSKRIYGDVGCASRFGATNLDRTVFMFGADGKFYRLEDYSWQRISTRPIEQAIRGLNWSQAFCFAWEDAGHSVAYWTFPDGFTWGFDQSTQLWHRRKSLGLDRWRPNTSTQLGQDWYMGDFQSGRIWRMDWDYLLEGEDEIESERVTGVLSDNQNLVTVSRLELLFATGQEMTVAPNPLFPEQPPMPSITGQAPDGVRNLPYGIFSYSGSGGTGVLTYSVRPNEDGLPPGLSLDDATGALTGMPTVDGSYPYVVRVTDENGLWAELSDSVIISASLMALATENFLFEFTAGVLGESASTNMLNASPRSLSITDNSRFVAAGFPGVPFLRLGEVNASRTNYNVLPQPAIEPDGVVQSTAFTGDGKFLAIGWRGSDLEYKVSVYEISDNTFTHKDTKSQPAPADRSHVAWSPDGLTLAWSCMLGAPDYGARFYEFNPVMGLLGAHKVFSSLSNPGSCSMMKFHPNGRYVAFGSSPNLDIADTQGVQAIIIASSIAGEPDSFRGVAWSPDGTMVYTAALVPSSGNYLAAYGFTGSSLSAASYPATQPASAVNQASLSYDGLYLAAGVSSAPGASLMLYDVTGVALTIAATQPVTTEQNTYCTAWTGSGA